MGAFSLSLLFKVLPIMSLEPKIESSTSVLSRAPSQELSNVLTPSRSFISTSLSGSQSPVRGESACFLSVSFETNSQLEEMGSGMERTVCVFGVEEVVGGDDDLLYGGEGEGVHGDVEEDGVDMTDGVEDVVKVEEDLVEGGEEAEDRAAGVAVLENWESVAEKLDGVGTVVDKMDGIEVVIACITVAEVGADDTDDGVEQADESVIGGTVSVLPLSVTGGLSLPLAGPMLLE